MLQLRVKTGYYTLFELMVIIAVSMLLLSSTLRFFHSTVSLLRSYSREAELNQKVFLIKKAIRPFFHKNGVPDNVKKDEIIYRNGCSISIRKDNLFIDNWTEEKEIALPKGVVVSFEKEIYESEFLVIMTLKSATDKPQDPGLRIVSAISLNKFEPDKN